MQRNEVTENLKNENSNGPDKMEIYKRSVANSAALIEMLKSGNDQTDLEKSVTNAELMFDLYPNEKNREMYGKALTEQRIVFESRKRSSQENSVFRPNSSSTASSVASSSSSSASSVTSSPSSSASSVTSSYCSYSALKIDIVHVCNGVSN